MDGVILFWLPKEVIYYVIIPICVIILIYFIFSLAYRKKKGTRYYNYVVDYVYSTLGVIFCSLLLSLILGYSISTLRLLLVNRVIQNYIPMVCALVVLPFIPLAFLIYLIRVYIKNLKRKEFLDKGVDEIPDKEDKFTSEKTQDKSEIVNENKEEKKVIYEDAILVKKK